MNFPASEVTQTERSIVNRQSLMSATTHLEGNSAVSQCVSTQQVHVYRIHMY